ncbi:MAG TPA: hypothetical protein V6D47_04480 [Oscillatoriaceae cyanobacterium]
MSISTVYPSASSNYSIGSLPSVGATSSDPSAISTTDSYTSSGVDPSQQSTGYDPSMYSDPSLSTDPSQAAPSYADPSQSYDPSQLATSSDPTQAQPPVVSVPVNNYDPSQATDPSQAAAQDPSLSAPAGQPVAAKSTGGMLGFLGGAAAGGFLSWKFLLPMIAKGKSPAGMLVAGVVGLGAAVGGWLGHKLLNK